MERTSYQPQLLPQRGERKKAFYHLKSEVEEYFWRGAVVISIIAFIVGRKVSAKTIPILLC